MSPKNAAISWSYRAIDDFERMLKRVDRVKYYNNNCVVRTCVPSILCCPCITWSIVFRILACPFQCIIKGPHAIISNNNCTNITDKCIETMCNEVSKEIEHDNTWMQHITSDKEIAEIVTTALYTFVRLMNTATTTSIKYKMCDYINKIIQELAKSNKWESLADFGALPSNIKKAIDTVVLPLINVIETTTNVVKLANAA